ncbi:MAG: arginine repressor [Actinomycetes bacterium]|jgi:transcriptional regulator of arginine metabolism
MAKVNMQSATARRSMVIKLVDDGLIHSQNDLVRELGNLGFFVTQATASRDLEELGAVRGKDNSGIFRYQFVATPESNKSKGIADLISSIDSSGNLAVIKTPPGAAQLLAGNLDRATKSGKLHSAIGTIAGDDTVLVVSKSATGGASLAREINKLLGAK